MKLYAVKRVIAIKNVFAFIGFEKPAGIPTVRHPVSRVTGQASYLPVSNPLIRPGFPALYTHVFCANRQALIPGVICFCERSKSSKRSDESET